MAAPFIAFALAGATLLAGADPKAADKRQDALLAVLASDTASREAKAHACRDLAAVATAKAVPALAELLGDEDLSHMARYAMEPIPDPAVDAALRQALSKLTGRCRAGVIASLGVRRDAQAVPALAELLAGDDPDAAHAAARALGSIATGEAGKALMEALPGAAGKKRLPVCEGLLRWAEALLARGRRDEAAAVYDRLRELAEPHQVRTAALRGAVLARGADGLPLLRQALGSKEFIVFTAALRTADEVPGAEATKALADELAGLPADRRIVLIGALARRADPAAMPALLAAAKSGPKPVRIAAVRAVAGLGDPAAVPGLTNLLTDPDADVARAAGETLAALPGPKVDAAVIAMLAGEQAQLRRAAVDLIGRRRMKSAVGALLRATDDADADLRQAAFERLGELAGPDQIAGLADRLMRTAEPRDIAAAEEAIRRICARTDAAAAHVERLVALLGQAKPAQRAALVRLVGGIGGDAACQAVRGALRDADADVRAAAVRTLCAWKTPEVLPDLLALARKGDNARDRTLALRAYLDWAANPKAGLPDDKCLAMCREAAGLAERPDEKKRLLAALGVLSSAAAIELILPHLDDDATRQEAGAAVVAVAERLLRGRTSPQAAGKLVEPLEKAVQAVKDRRLLARAAAARKRARARAAAK